MRVWRVWLALGLIGLSLLTVAARSSRPGPRMAEAATRFLAVLTPEQRARAVFPFADAERRNWHFVPRARKGISFKDLDSGGREAAHAFLRAALSQKGYLKTTQIISLEEILRALEGGRGPDRDPDLYYFSFFGEPSETKTWGWRVEGHHLSLNLTVVDGKRIASAPQFFGANPAEVKDGPRKGLRPLRGEEDGARALLKALTPEQRARAIIAEEAPRDILTGNSRKAEIGEPKGLPAAEMTGAQRKLLTALIDTYCEAMPDAVAAERRAALKKAGREKIHFAWAGGEEPGQPHYYRLQGPTFLVEYDNTQNRANHIHSVWRDFHGDFGADLLAAHYREHHHGAQVHAHAGR
jgi:hypothetical protein